VKKTLKVPHPFISLILTLLPYSLGLTFSLFLWINSALASDEIPNVIVIISDDQRHDDVESYTPIIKERIMDQGARFSRGYVTTPACCPSRASILTGLYTSEHEVIGNKYLLNKPTFVERLRQADVFYTGLIGKYLNTWDGSARPEFDYWVSFPRGSSRYNNPRLNINGTWVDEEKYITHTFRDHALGFLTLASQQERPFLLILSFNAPHAPSTPYLDDQGRFKNEPLHRPPSYNRVVKKPHAVAKKSPLSLKKKAALDKKRQRERECLWSLDQAVGAIIERLEEEQILDNTAIFYLSDNGVMRGEHRLESKDVPYEEAIRVPFAFRYPKAISAGVYDKLVANIDIAPTIYELAGLENPPQVSGLSLLKLASNPKEWREELLIEGFRRTRRRKRFAVIHTGEYVYIFNERLRGKVRDRFRNELYDLKSDPFQIDNKIRKKAYTDIRDDLKKRLNTLLIKHRGTTSFGHPKGERDK
jgi:arylsulfatase A-like enzyme